MDLILTYSFVVLSGTFLLVALAIVFDNFIAKFKNTDQTLSRNNGVMICHGMVRNKNGNGVIPDKRLSDY